MIENLNIWAKSIILSIIVVSILEMLLPNNKTKKYVKMTMGVFILYNIISPFIRDKNSLTFSGEDFEIENYKNDISNTIEVNQESMDKRLEELYIEQIEKDIKKKVEKQGYIVRNCKVKAKITDNEKDTGISKIKLSVEKNNDFKEQEEDSQEIENRIVNEIQKIKKVNTNIKETQAEETTSLSQVDIQNLKKFLTKEYEVNEKCLEIN